MRYVIYGAGAIGGGVGARLAQHGHTPVLIARGAHLAAMQRDGLRLRAPGEDFRVRVTAVGHPSEVDWHGDEFVILTMKGQDTAGALADLLAAAGPDVPVACAQNGVENERQAARSFAHVYAMLVQMPATYLEPGEVILNGVSCSGILDAGVYPAGLDDRIREVCADLTAAGFIADPDPDVLRMKYAKLLNVNLGNAVQAICGPDAPADELQQRLKDEAYAAYAAAGIECVSSEQFWARDAQMTRGDVEGFKRSAGSTWQSLVSGRSLETDYLNGEIVLLGTLHGVPTPANRAIQVCSARAIRERLAPGAITVDEVLALADR